jgi:ADP-ribose pyrophosphatase YjhB (NUDIX family)
MATPRIAAGVLFRDEAGRVLLVKPTYKAGWDIPGGYVEPGESPKQAAQREVREELGLDVRVGPLLVVDWAPHPDEGDKVLFIFSGGKLGTGIDISPAAPDEIAETRFWSLTDLADALPPRLLRRVARAASTRGEAYLENGEPTGPIPLSSAWPSALPS